MSTRTKIILRIAVTLVVLGLVVLGVWLIWLKPTNELEIFQNLTSLQNNEQTKFQTSLNAEENGVKYGVKNRTYYTDSNVKYGVSDYNSTDSTKVVYGQIAYYRTYMFGKNDDKDVYTGFGATENTNPYLLRKDSFNNSINTTVSDYAGLEKAYNIIDEAFDYYYSYVQLAEDVERDDVREMNKLISDLSSDYAGFYSLQSGELTSLYKASATAANTKTILYEICAIYEKLYYKYFDIVESYTDLTLELKDFVAEYVFDGVVSYDKNTVAYDVALNSISEWISKSKEKNADGVANYKVFTTNADGDVVYNNNSVYIAYSADVAAFLRARSQKLITDAFVSTYAEVSENYRSALVSSDKGILKFSNEKKNTFVINYYNGTISEETKTYSEDQSTYNLDYLSNLQTILKTLFKLTDSDQILTTGEVA